MLELNSLRSWRFCSGARERASGEAARAREFGGIRSLARTSRQKRQLSKIE